MSFHFRVRNSNVCMTADSEESAILLQEVCIMVHRASSRTEIEIRDVGTYLGEVWSYRYRHHSSRTRDRIIRLIGRKLRRLCLLLAREKIDRGALTSAEANLWIGDIYSHLFYAVDEFDRLEASYTSFTRRPRHIPRRRRNLISVPVSMDSIDMLNDESESESEDEVEGSNHGVRPALRPFPFQEFDPFINLAPIESIPPSWSAMHSSSQESAIESPQFLDQHQEDGFYRAVDNLSREIRWSAL